MLKKLIKKLRKSDKGFTLIEMIVVIAIIGVLIAVIFPNVMGAINDAKSAAGRANARNAYLAAQMVAASQVNAGSTVSVDQAAIQKYLGNTLSSNTVSITVSSGTVTNVVYHDGTNSYSYGQ